VIHVFELRRKDVDAGLGWHKGGIAQESMAMPVDISAIPKVLSIVMVRYHLAHRKRPVQHLLVTIALDVIQSVAGLVSFLPPVRRYDCSV
jgi:hypothetical protein